MNIVSQVAILLQDLSEPLSYGNIPIAHKAIQALIELCTGNFANQWTVFKAQILGTIHNILHKRIAVLAEEVSLLWPWHTHWNIVFHVLNKP